MKKISILSLSLLLSLSATAQFRSDETPTGDGASGYQNILEVAYNLGGSPNSEKFAKLNMIFGHRFNPYFAAGLGTGFKYSWHGRYVSIPVFADFRGSFNQKPVSPYWSMSLGYYFDASNRMKGQGLMVNPQIGMKFKVAGNRSLSVGLGYEFQKRKLHYLQPDFSTFIRRENVRSFTVNVGFTF